VPDVVAILEQGRHPPPGRKGYLDWLRGAGVVVMIQGHVIDAWTSAAGRERTAHQWITFVGGIGGAPIFLFLAGVSLALAAGARMRAGRTDAEAVALARRRGWQILGLALLFRMQAWLISGGGLQTILKVDILNVIGVSMVAAAALWALARQGRPRALLLAAAAAAAAMLTPVVRNAGLLAVLPDPLERYLRPAAGATTFTLFPWAGFVLAGCAVGLWLESARTSGGERRANAAIGAAGLVLAAGGYAASLLPPVYADTSFWTSSPTFFFIRLGIVMALVAAAYALNRGAGRSPLAEFGRSSLFVYWIHVEMAYGVVSAPLHRQLPLEQAYLGFVLLTMVLFGIVKLKNRMTSGRAKARPLRPIGSLIPHPDPEARTRRDTSSWR